MADVFITDITQTSEIDDSMEFVGDNGSKTYSFTAPTLKKYITKDFVRPNLLDNWYFIKPVNQRGLSEYTGNAYGIDRWKGLSTVITVTVGNNVAVSTTSALKAGYRVWGQFIENGKALTGRTITLSILVSDCNGSFTISFGSNGTSSNRVKSTAFSTAGLYSVTGKIDAEITDFIVFIGKASEGDTSLKIEAIKLELGDTQTLAHQDANGNWVLNEIPNYADQLAKCQRHFVRFANFGSYIRSLGTGLATNTAGTNARFSIPIPVPMRTKPSISVSSYSSVYCYRAGTRASVTELKVIDVQGDMGNVIVVDATTSGLTAQEICNLAVASCTIEFSAEITA